MSARRGFLTGSVAIAASGLLPRPSVARSGATGRQAPGYYRLALGSVEVTALLDGHLDLPPALFSAPEAEIGRLLAQDFRPAGPIRTAVNAYAVNVGGRLTLVDAGTNAGFHPGLAMLPEALRAAGLAPEAVDAVALTHLHPDHAGGLARDGKALFPNAQLLVAEREAAFWLDDASVAPAMEGMQALVGIARAALAPYAGRIRRFEPGVGSVAPGVEATPLPGHTPGHTGYLVGDGDARLWIWGDVVHAAALQFPQPGITIAVDVNPAAAVQTRRDALARAAAGRILVAGTHLPFPGIGQVLHEAAGAYRFVPAPWQPLRTQETTP